MIHYIYVLIDPRDGRVRYVGQTADLKIRYRGHCASQCEKNYRAYWLTKIRSLGLKPFMRVIEECNEFNWPERETYWIKHYRELGYDLVNATDGGEGTKGWKPSEEWKQKASKRLKGVKKSLEHVQHMSESQSGEKHHFYGKKRPDHSKRMTGEGNPTVGEKHPNSKLTKEKVLEIKKLLDDGEHGREIAKRYNVNDSVISRIRHGTRWGWLK